MGRNSCNFINVMAAGCMVTILLLGIECQVLKGINFTYFNKMNMLMGSFVKLLYFHKTNHVVVMETDTCHDKPTSKTVICNPTDIF